MDKSNKQVFLNGIKALMDAFQADINDLSDVNNLVISNKFQLLLDRANKNMDFNGCPHCSSKHIIRYGKTKQGLQRYLCKDCGKTFTVKTGTLTAYSKKSITTWYQFIIDFLHEETIKSTSKDCMICKQTALVWRHKIANILFSDIEDPELEGTVYLDETFVRRYQPGYESNEPKEPKKRGISDQKRNIACAVDEKGNYVIEVSLPGRITSKELIRIFEDKIPSSCTVVSDSQRSYHQLMKKLEVKWIKIPSGKKEKDGYTLSKVNGLHSAIKFFLRNYRGVADKYLKHYIAIFKYRRKINRMTFKEKIDRTFGRLVLHKCNIKYRDIRGYNSADYMYAITSN